MLRQIHQIADLTKLAMGIADLSNRQQIADFVKSANFVADFVKLAMDCQICQIQMIWHDYNMNRH